MTQTSQGALVGQANGSRGPRVVSQPFYTSSPYEPQLPPVERLEDIDLTDPALYERGDPHAAFALLREQAPVFWHEKGTRGTRGRGFWAVTSYEGFEGVHRNPQYYSRADTPFLDLLAPDLPRQIVCLDPPEHTFYRRLLQPFFSPRAMERMEAHVEGIVKSIFDSLPRGEVVNFALQVAQPIPFLVTCAFLGFPVPEMAALGAEVAQLDFEDPASMQKAAAIIKSRFDELAGDYADPDGLVTTVLEAEYDGERLPRDVALSQIWLVFIGALDTTTHATTYGLTSFFHHPDEFQRLRDDPGLMSSAIEEILRWTAPAQVVKYLVKEPTVLQGVQLQPGDYTATYLGSACRDERYFPDPYRFDIGRQNTHTITTFGSGPHTCLGAHMTRLELKHIFGELLSRYSTIEQAGPVELGRAFSLLLVPPVQSLPVVLT